jgi:hypothetical protein
MRQGTQVTVGLVVACCALSALCYAAPASNLPFVAPVVEISAAIIGPLALAVWSIGVIVAMMLAIFGGHVFGAVVSLVIFGAIGANVGTVASWLGFTG